jgi:hypothetical protein
MSKAGTESKWAARVAAWRESGQSAAKFAEGRGFAGSTLRWWSQRLPAQVSPVEKCARVAAERPTPKLELVRVARAAREVAPSVARLVGSHVVELETLRVRVEPGFDEAALRAIVAALRGAP